MDRVDVCHLKFIRKLCCFYAIECAKMSFAIFSILGPMPSSTGVLAEFNPLINSDTCVMEVKGISDGCNSVFYQ